MRTIYLGYDHNGFAVRDAILQYLKKRGFSVLDFGNKTLEPTDDYPDFAEKVSTHVENDPGSVGILLCGSGEGICIAANKFKGIRAASPATLLQASSSIHDDNANVLCFGTRVNAVEEIIGMLDIAFATSFGGERHQRRIDKISAIEDRNFK